MDLIDRALRGDVVDGPLPGLEPSYHSYPTAADRAASRSTGGRFGLPFTLHRRVPLG